MLAAASSDGTVSLLTYQNGPGWTAHKVWPAALCTRFCCSLCGYIICFPYTIACILGLHDMLYAGSKCPPLGGDSSLMGTSSACRLTGISQRPWAARDPFCFLWRRQHCQGAMSYLNTYFKHVLYASRTSKGKSVSPTRIFLCSSSCAVPRHYDGRSSHE